MNKLESAVGYYSRITVSICVILKRQRYGSSELITVIDRLSASPESNQNQSHVPPLICINYRTECHISPVASCIKRLF